MACCPLTAPNHYLNPQCWFLISEGFYIHMRAILQWVPKLPLCIMSFKSIPLKSLPYLPCANEFISLLLAKFFKKFINPYESEADNTFIISFTADILSVPFNSGQFPKYLNNQNVNQRNAFENCTFEIVVTFFWSHRVPGIMHHLLASKTNFCSLVCLDEYCIASGSLKLALFTRCQHKRELECRVPWKCLPASGHCHEIYVYTYITFLLVWNIR